jgi:hypothetical protein
LPAPKPHEPPNFSPSVALVDACCIRVSRDRQSLGTTRVLPRGATAPASVRPAAGLGPPDRRRLLVTCWLYERSAPMDGVRRFTGDHPRKEQPNFGLGCAQQVCDTRAAGKAGPQKRDHGRPGRKSASHASQRRVSTASSGASALRPFAGGLSTSSATGDETHFCPVPLPRKTPFGGSLYRTRRNGRSPSLKVHLAAA